MCDKICMFVILQNNLVFRMDFPENTMTFGRKIPPYKISDQIIRGSIIAIFISEVIHYYVIDFAIRILKFILYVDSQSLQILVSYLQETSRIG